jgi:hypothetical protein
VLLCLFLPKVISAEPKNHSTTATHHSFGKTPLELVPHFPPLLTLWCATSALLHVVALHFHIFILQRPWSEGVTKSGHSLYLLVLDNNGSIILSLPSCENLGVCRRQYLRKPYLSSTFTSASTLAGLGLISVCVGLCRDDTAMAFKASLLRRA